MLLRLREQPFFPSEPEATHTTWKINDCLGDCCLLGSLRWGQCLFTLRRGRWFNGWHSALACSFRTVRQPHPGWPGLHLPAVPLLGFYVLKRFTKQMDTFMAERLLGPLHAMMSVGLPDSPLQIVGWYIILRREPHGFPCPALHIHCWPLPEKKVWTEWTSGLTLHMEGENFVFIPACSWGMPASGPLWPLWSCSFTHPHTPLSPVLGTVFTSSHHAAPPQSRSSRSVGSTEISSQAKPRCLLLPTLCHFFLVQ